MTLDQGINIVFAGGLLFLVAAGLAIVWGVMDVINLAHGAFLMIGAHAALLVTRQDLSPWFALPAGAILAGGIGLVVEALIIRFLYARPLDTLLATWGLALVLVAAVQQTLGRSYEFVSTPIIGVAHIGSAAYPYYRLLMLGIAAVLFLIIWLVLRYTRVGIMARGVIMNEALAAGLGVDTRRVRRWTFVSGCALGGLAGALVAPLAAVEPNMGTNYLIGAFMVVLVAGKASLWGLLVASFLLAGSQLYVSVTVSPLWGNVVLMGLAVLIMRFWPNGIGSPRGQAS